MDRQMIIDHLELAERHVAEGASRVGRQRQLLTELICDGLPSLQSKLLLKTFEECLAMHIADRERLLKELNKIA
jgi:hypothetical protein